MTTHARHAASATGEALVLLGAVSLAGAVGLTAWGSRAAGAIGDRAGRARTAAVATEAAAASGARWLAEFSREPRVVRRAIGARLPLELPPTNVLSPPAPVHDPGAVARIREAAHALWLRTPLEARDAARTTVTIDGRAVDVGAVPIHSRLDLEAIDPVMTRFSNDSGWRTGDARLAQEARLMALLDDALDLAVSLGHTGLRAPTRVERLGADLTFSGYRPAYLPNGMWELRMHGQPSHFVEYDGARRANVVSPLDVAAQFRRAGHRPGEPIALRVCLAGACTADGPNAAQALADALDTPVIAASERVSPSPNGRALVTKDADGGSYTLGEWRLFQPASWGQLPAARRLVIGRGAGPGELGLGAVTDLARVPPSTADRVEIAGHWRQYYDTNEGALALAARALRPGGRLVLRAPGGRALQRGGIVATLRRSGFSIDRTVDGEQFLVIAHRAADVPERPSRLDL